MRLAIFSILILDFFVMSYITSVVVNLTIKQQGPNAQRMPILFIYLAHKWLTILFKVYVMKKKKKTTGDRKG